MTFEEYTLKARDMIHESAADGVLSYKNLIVELVNLAEAMHKEVKWAGQEAMLEAWSRLLYQDVLSSVAADLGRCDIKKIRLRAWPGIPGAGKGTNLRVFSSAFAALEGHGTHLKQALLDEVVPHTYLKTGTGGIMKPAGDQYYEDRFDKLWPIVKAEMDSGRLISDYSMTVLMLLVLGERVRDFASQNPEQSTIIVQTDLWPRSSYQQTLFQELGEALKDRNLILEKDFLLFSLVPPEDLWKLTEDRSKTLQAAEAVHAFFVSLTGQKLASFDELNNSIDREINSMYLERGSITSEIVNISVIFYKEVEAAVERARLRQREDDNATAFVSRMEAYFGSTLIPYLKVETPIVSTNQTPADMVESVLETLIGDVNVDHTAHEYRELMDEVRRQATRLIEV